MSASGRVAIVAVGDELLAGAHPDLNSPWLAARMAEGGRAVHVHPIVREDERLGSVVLVRDLSGVVLHVLRQIALLFAALAIALLLTLLLTRRLKRAVERPVAQLADVTQRLPVGAAQRAAAGHRGPGAAVPVGRGRGAQRQQPVVEVADAGVE